MHELQPCGNARNACGTMKRAFSASSVISIRDWHCIKEVLSLTPVTGTTVLSKLY
jgi:hypothetical protein